MIIKTQRKSFESRLFGRRWIFWKQVAGVRKDHPIAKEIKGCPTAVKWLQSRLNALGYHTEIDGNIGNGCDAMIKAFQRDHGLSADGWVGLKTVPASYLNKF